MQKNFKKKWIHKKLLFFLSLYVLFAALIVGVFKNSPSEVNKNTITELSSLTPSPANRNFMFILDYVNPNKRPSNVNDSLKLDGLILRNPLQLKMLNDGFLHPSKILNSTESSNSATQSFFSDKKVRMMMLDIKNKIAKRIIKPKLTSYNLTTPHRLFNPEWFGSENAELELVGVINRMDRWAFSSGNCGELRLVYRLSYLDKRNTSIYSRLPLTMMMSFWQNPADKNCGKLATRWLTVTDILDPHWLTKSSNFDSPLRFANLKNIKSIEFNLQAERWPSTMKPSTAGHAEYDLWVFKFNSVSQQFERGKLENTPDVSKLLSNRPLLRRLEEFLLKPESLKNLDDGTLTLPEEYLSDSITSYAFHGSARMSNRPFTKLFDENTFSKINFKRYKMITSPLATLTRLNELSCTGCHQTRTIAGFHFLGEDLPLTSSFNSIKSGMSSHLRHDLVRREEELKNWLNGTVFNIPREFSARSINEVGTLGSFCSADLGLKDWTCPSPLFCGYSNLTLTEKIGRCEMARLSRLSSGAACNEGTMSSTSNPNDEIIYDQKMISCGPLSICEPSASGFPGGMCTRNCSLKTSDEICGPIALLGPLNTCLTEGKEFDGCLKSSARMSALQSCDLNKTCREDYVCAKVQGETMGACIPPYFLLQLRVDGHPTPTKGNQPSPL